MSVKLQPPTWGFICTQGFLVTIYSPNKPSLCSLPSGKQAELARNPTENFLILLEKLKLSLGAGIVLLFFIQSACVKSLWPGPCYIYVFTLWMFRCCCLGRWWNQRPWRCSRCVWIYIWVMRVCGLGVTGASGAGLMGDRVIMKVSSKPDASMILY